MEEYPIESRIGIAIKGAFLGEHYNDLATNTMTIFLSLIHHDGKEQVKYLFELNFSFSSNNSL